MNNIDALFINPDGLAEVYGALRSNIMTIEPPVMAMMLSSSLKVGGFKSKIIDCVIESHSEESLIDVVKKISPRLVVLAAYGQHPSASTHVMHGAGIVARALKKHLPEIKIVILGGHVSALPEKTLNEEQVDFVIKGEGIYSLRELLSTDLESREQLEKVSGLYFYDGKKLRLGPEFKLVPQEEIDKELPGIDLADIDPTRYRAPNWFLFGDLDGRDTYGSIYTSLGCPYSCHFCCIHSSLKKSSYRHWSKETVLNQLEELYKRGVKNIKIADELFTLKESHYLPLCEELAEKNYDFNIWAFARIESIKKEALPTLKKAGINWLVLGIESFDNIQRGVVGKGQFTKDDIIEKVRAVQDAGIKVHANFMFGLPNDDIGSMQRNLEFAMSLNVETANFYCSMPYPGSGLYNEALEKGWPMPESWLAYTQHGKDSLPLPTNNLTGGEVLTFRDQAWTIFHQNPNYLKMMEEKFGRDTVEYIHEITKTKLVRNHGVNRQLAKPNY